MLRKNPFCVTLQGLLMACCERPSPVISGFHHCWVNCLKSQKYRKSDYWNGWTTLLIYWAESACGKCLTSGRVSAKGEEQNWPERKKGKVWIWKEWGGNAFSVTVNRSTLLQVEFMFKEKRKNTQRTPTDSGMHFPTETTSKSPNFSHLLQSEGITLLLI